MIHVIREYARPDKELVAKFRQLPAATIYEAAGQTGMMDPDIRPVYPGAQICGTAVTVKCHPGDNLMLHKAVVEAKPGDVLVATIGNHVEAGAWGEILATASIARGITGLVIDGAVRDSEAMQRKQFPVFSRGLCIGATMKRNLGTINHPIVCGNVLVEPGDIIIGDADGIVVVPKERATEIYELSVEREEKEAVMMTKLEQGITTLELLNLTAVLNNLGIQEE